MPTFVGQFYNDLMIPAWEQAGFTGNLQDKTKGGKIKSGVIISQTPPAQTSVQCNTNGSVTDE